jgi:hypothetical protein
MKITALLCGLVLALGAAPAAADDHRSDRAGHPLKIIGTILHPVGVVLDYVIFRPAHWLQHHEPVKTLTGHEEED